MNKKSKFNSAMLHADGYEKPDNKKCTLCHQYLPIESFSVNHKNGDGHSNNCKQCASKKAYKRTLKVREDKKFYEQFMPI